MTENRREFAAFLGKKREVAFGSADIACKNHRGPQVSCFAPRQHALFSRVPLPRGRGACLVRIVPMASVALEQGIGLRRTPAAGGILRNGGALGGVPDI